MKRAARVLLTAVFLLQALPAFAVPDAGSISRFNDEIEKERRDFEQKARIARKGPRTLEVEAFEKRRREETVRFQNQLETVPLDGQRAAVREYQEKVRVDRAEHLEKLKKLPFEPNNLQKERKEFDRKVADKMRRFYQD